MWINETVGLWAHLFQTALGRDQIIATTYLAEGHSNRRQSVPFSERCLPETSMSLLGLLLHLTRWCQTAKWLGGLGDMDQRVNARALLCALITKAATLGKWSFLLELLDRRDAWACAWPRPLHWSKTVAEVHVKGELADFGEFCEASTRPQASTAAKAQWRALCKALPLLQSSSQMKLDEVFVSCLRAKH